MGGFPEIRLRALVADTLGVDVADLSPDVSLVDDLAADSLDVAELVVRVETELGITLADRVVDRVRTYGELVRAALAACRAPATMEPIDEPLLVRARLVSAHGELLRAEALTPYAAETLAGDALAAGHGAYLELAVPPDAEDAAVDRVRARFAWLDRHGIMVQVGRDEAGRRSAAA